MPGTVGLVDSLLALLAGLPRQAKVTQQCPQGSISIANQKEIVTFHITMYNPMSVQTGQASTKLH